MMIRSLLIAGVIVSGCSNDVQPVDARAQSTSSDDAKAAKSSKKISKETDSAAKEESAAKPAEETASTPSPAASTEPVKPAAPTVPPLVTGDAKFTVSAAQPVNQNLGTTKTYTYKVTPAAGFTGKVDLTVDKAAFDALDTGKGTQITVTPASLDFASGAPQDATVSVAVGTISPSIKDTDAAGHFTLIAASGASKIESKVGMTINPVFEIQMKGNSAATMVYTPNLTTMDFKSHAAGLKLRFVNMDPAATNVVHGNGSIPHGPVGAPLAASPDGGTTPGGAYEVNIAPTQTAVGSFYSHSYEANGNRRTMNFGK